MSVRITQLLYDNGEIDAIDGIIVVNGGEYSIYDRDIATSSFSSLTGIPSAPLTPGVDHHVRHFSASSDSL
jgi:hypothetical protein